MSRQQPPQSTRKGFLKDQPLPEGFTLIRDVLVNGQYNLKTVSIIGVVKDYMRPRATAGADWKSRIALYDQSIEEFSEYMEGIQFNIFRPEGEHPQVQTGDVVIVSMAKSQNPRDSSFPSLLSNFATDIHVYDAQRIADCGGSQSASAALRPPSKKVRRKLDQKLHQYVFWLYNKIDKKLVPDRDLMASQGEQTLNIKNKFSLLQDVKVDQFVDLLVHVVRPPYDLGDAITLYVSDYTENSEFFDKRNNDSDWVDGGRPIHDGDPYGYLGRKRKKPTSLKASEEWLGPYGKMSIQLTCWEPHAGYIRSNVQAGDWVFLRNVQIGKKADWKMEGFIRCDRVYPGRIYVQALTPTDDLGSADPRLKDAIRRRREYWKGHKRTTQRSPKRKAEEPIQNDNSKIRRKLVREEKAKAFQEMKTKQEALVGLNKNIKCENANKELVPFSSILEPVRYDTTFELPFTCAKYRTQARVVDFHPAKLEDFAVSRVVTVEDLLSDNSSGSDSDSDSDSVDSSEDSDRGGRRYRPRDRLIWEWRFALKLEEVSPMPTTIKGKKLASAWVLVDNADAQLLTDLNARDLRAEDDNTLLQLRNRMFILWGDLEERKAEIEKRRKSSTAWQQTPALHSDDEHNNGSGSGAGHISGLKNKPFNCCIRQYGVKVKAEEGEEVNAGKRRWQRVFGLFGTKISE